MYPYMSGCEIVKAYDLTTFFMPACLPACLPDMHHPALPCITCPALPCPAVLRGAVRCSQELWKPALRAHMEREMLRVSDGSKRKEQVLRGTLEATKTVFQQVGERERGSEREREGERKGEREGVWCDG